MYRQVQRYKLTTPLLDYWKYHHSNRYSKVLERNGEHDEQHRSGSGIGMLGKLQLFIDMLFTPAAAGSHRLGLRLLWVRDRQYQSYIDGQWLRIRKRYQHACRTLPHVKAHFEFERAPVSCVLRNGQELDADRRGISGPLERRGLPLNITGHRPSWTGWTSLMRSCLCC
jgi:hypothetical protein